MIVQPLHEAEQRLNTAHAALSAIRDRFLLAADQARLLGCRDHYGAWAAAAEELEPVLALLEGREILDALPACDDQTCVLAAGHGGAHQLTRD